jgi:hypothetical protein
MHQGAFHTLGDSSDPTKSADYVQLLSWEQQVLLLGYSSFAKLIRMAGREDIDAS